MQKKNSLKLLVLLVLITISLGLSFILLNMTTSTNNNSSMSNITITEQQQSPIKVVSPKYIITEGNIENAVSVLMYHEITDNPTYNNYDNNIISFKNLSEQLNYLKQNNYTTITMSEFIAWHNSEINLPKKSVLLTFDDGFKSIHKLLLPLLEKNNQHAVSFIIGGFSFDPNNNHMGSDLIRSLRNNSYLSLESHTYNLHQAGSNGRGMIETVSKEEMIKDNQLEESLLGHKINTLAYPFGHHDNNTFENMRAANIRLGFIIENNDATRNSNPLAIPRLRVNATTTLDSFITLVKEN